PARSTLFPYTTLFRSQAFSRREVAISLLDARAGSPPSASELLWRHRGDPGARALTELLRDWERWAADVLESHLSYPPLAYFRSRSEEHTSELQSRSDL